MILTRKKFRTIKTALMQIPGNPGSSKLGEALSRGFGYDDYHALKAQIDMDEGNLCFVPKPTDLDPDALISALGDLDAQVSKDIAATTMFLHEGSFFMEDLESSPQLQGGRVMLTSAAPKAWVDAAGNYLKNFFEALEDEMAFTFRPDQDMWDGIEFPNPTSSVNFGISRPEHGHSKLQAGDRSLDELDYQTLELYETPEMPNIQFFAEGMFFHIRDSIPEAGRDDLKYFYIDKTGVFGIFGSPFDTEPRMEIVYLEVSA